MCLPSGVHEQVLEPLCCWHAVYLLQHHQDEAGPELDHRCTVYDLATPCEQSLEGPVRVVSRANNLSSVVHCHELKETEEIPVESQFGIGGCQARANRAFLDCLESYGLVSAY